MGSRIESTVVIERPVQEVFDFFLNLDESAPRVDPELLSVVKTPDGPAGPGTTFRFRQKMFGKPRETTTRFTAIEPNREIQFEAVLGPIRLIAILMFEPAGAGTRVKFTPVQPGWSVQAALAAHQPEKDNASGRVGSRAEVHSRGPDS